MVEKYNPSNIALEQILNFIKSGEIAIPEIQRPFVWKPKQVRDLGAPDKPCGELYRCQPKTVLPNDISILC